MPLPVRSLPVIQNWDCHGCSDCCRTYHVAVSDAEKKAIEAQGWESDRELGSVERIVWDRKAGGYRLNHRADGACVFLDEANRCRIHGKFGSTGKPLACRVFPFIPVPTGDHWRVGMRFACPSVADNKGRPLPQHAAEVREYTAALESSKPAVVPAPPLGPGQVVEWPDLIRFTKAIGELLATPGRRVERSLRGILAVVAECKRAKFDKLSGKRLDEFLGLISAVADDVPADPYSVLSPGWVGRMVFRNLLALYVRKDIGLNRGTMADRGPLARASAAWRFARGSGRIPPVHALIPDTTFEAVEAATGSLPDESEELLARYYRVKVESMQFCGATNHHLGFWDGLDSLILTYPAIRWLGRVLVIGGRSPADAIRLAVQMVDHNFGYNPLLGAGRQVWAVRTLDQKLELPRLVAWYSR